MYYERFNFLVDYETSLKSFGRLLRSGAFCRTVEDNGEIIAWILCSKVKLFYLDEPVFQQDAFSCSRCPYRTIELLHKEMIANSPTDLIFSSGSFLDERNTFARILEKQGWNRKGYLAWTRKKEHLI
jgi:hypothetical protein